VRYYVNGEILKKQRDADDQQALDGVAHRWPVLPQAARAIEVLERPPHSADSDVLCLDSTGQPLDSAASTARSGPSSSWPTSWPRHRLLAIAEHEAVSAGRLRRTIGPFIRNRPEGAFGLAVVYGHASSIVGAGYGGMKHTGSTRFLPQATAEHITATLNSLTASLHAGGGVSGPAAHQALAAAATFQGAIMTSRDWKKIVANPDIQAYDNPDSAVGCRFDPAVRPPCQNDTGQDAQIEPDLVNCHPRCANRFCTDQDAIEHGRQADRLDSWAELAPVPEAVRLRRRATGHRAIAEHHWATRIGAGGTSLPTDRSSVTDTNPLPEIDDNVPESDLP
jgi:hypothetical protein